MIRAEHTLPAAAAVAAAAAAAPSNLDVKGVCRRFVLQQTYSVDLALGRVALDGNLGASSDMHACSVVHL